VLFRSMAFGVAAALGFASIRRALFPVADPLLPTLQFVFFPILFPFFFLFYTDVPSLALVLWTFRLALDGRHALAGAVGIAALLMRQTNVFWIAAIALLQWVELRPARGTLRAQLAAALPLWPYALPVLAFAAYWIAHGSISLSQSQVRAHPDLALHSGNLFFMLFVAGAFFVPLLPAWIARYAGAVRARPAWLLLPVALGVLYALTFKVDHLYNQILPELIVRNGILVATTRDRWAFAAFGAVAVVAGCALTQVRWQRASFALLLPLSAVFVSASWLIEQRYYLIPFALLLATRHGENPVAERVLLAWWVPVAMGFVVGMLSARFFL
jgi:alpha-1,2-glucosyltransferase